MNKYVTMLQAYEYKKPTGGKMSFPKGAQALLDEALADEFILLGVAEPYPNPLDEPVAPAPGF